MFWNSEFFKFQKFGSLHHISWQHVFKSTLHGVNGFTRRLVPKTCVHKGASLWYLEHTDVCYHSKNGDSISRAAGWQSHLLCEGMGEQLLRQAWMELHRLPRLTSRWLHCAGKKQVSVAPDLCGLGLHWVKLLHQQLRVWRDTKSQPEVNTGVTKHCSPTCLRTEPPTPKSPH